MVKASKKNTKQFLSQEKLRKRQRRILMKEESSRPKDYREIKKVFKNENRIHIEEEDHSHEAKSLCNTTNSAGKEININNCQPNYTKIQEKDQETIKKNQLNEK
jgi:hypothetical protein